MPGHDGLPWPWLGEIALVACAALIVGLVTLLRQGAATSANAYTVLRQIVQSAQGSFPSSGVSTFSYAQIPWYLLPPGVAHYAGHHRIITHWRVRDATHFRVDVQALDPAPERGTITAALDGDTLTTHDARSGKATVPRGRPLQQLSMTPSQLLSFAQNGARFAGIYGPGVPNARTRSPRTRH